MKNLHSLLLLTLAWLGTGVAYGQSPSTWIDCSGRHWHADARGLAYFQVEQAGVVHRVYADPVRYAMARRIEQHLSQVGLPRFCEPPVIDRRRLNAPACYGASSYSPLDSTAHLLDTVDWQAAVRQGVRGAIIRGFNAMQLPAEKSNSAAHAPGETLPAPHHDSSQTLQRLVEQGVEDALIQGFNQLQTGPVRQPAEQLPTPASQPPAEQLSQPHDKPTDPLKLHLAEQPKQLLADQKYDRFQPATIGWYVDHDGTIKPLETADQFVIAFLEEGQQRADLWQHGEVLHTYILFARYFEDARQLKQKYY